MSASERRKAWARLLVIGARLMKNEQFLFLDHHPPQFREVNRWPRLAFRLVGQLHDLAPQHSKQTMRNAESP